MIPARADATEINSAPSGLSTMHLNFVALVQEFATLLSQSTRLASDHVSVFARGMITYANATPTPKAAIQPLYDLARRYPPDTSYLTSLHSQFALLCIQTKSPTALLPVLETPITNISLTFSPDLAYNDSLMYHYLDAIAYAELKFCGQAAEFSEIALNTPGSVPAALQLEALKKLRIVQLISSGKTAPTPKYTHALLPRLFKNGPYNAFVNAYPRSTDVLHEIATRDAATFASEKNTGLIALALSRTPRWTLKKLALTCVTLTLSDIARAIKLPDEEAVRSLLLDMAVKNRDDAWAPQAEELFAHSTAGVWADDVGFTWASFALPYF